jgi:hypothetical protein
MLKQSTVCVVAAAALVATTAFAQAPQPPSARAPNPPAAGQSTPPPPSAPRREEGPPPPSKAAHFRVEQGESGIDVTCADDEPMRACADLAMQFLDRLGISQSPTTGSAPARR